MLPRLDGFELLKQLSGSCKSRRKRLPAPWIRPFVACPGTW
jgi:hypothetical protein